MASDTTVRKFELLQHIFRLSQEQHRALQADHLERFADLMSERERLMADLLSIQPPAAPDDDLPPNVIPFPGRWVDAVEAAEERATSDDQLALTSIIRGILLLDERNEHLLAEKMGQVRQALQGVSRGRGAARRYRAEGHGPGTAVDRAG